MAPRIEQVMEPAPIEKLVTNFAVKTFDMAVLRGLPWLKGGLTLYGSMRYDMRQNVSDLHSHSYLVLDCPALHYILSFGSRGTMYFEGTTLPFREKDLPC